MASDEFSLAFLMANEKSKDEDTRMKESNTKQDCVRYTVQDKVRFFDLKIEKVPECISCGKAIGILTEEHKMTVINSIDVDPSVTVVEVTEHLLDQFNDLKVSRSTVYNFMKRKCSLSLKKADLHHYGA
ncbi:hypothetical protein G6F56_008342 [Rhizopus delemar]|nr:hypothetical protein G6F56_008342 [Rhizopus delemar]